MAKILIRKSYIDVVGHIWMPRVVCSMRINLTPYDIDNIRDQEDGSITREVVDAWLAMHSGDFQTIIDWRASIEDGDKTIDFDFESEDGEMQYYDTINTEE